MPDDSPSAAVCLIGNELLSGRTRDINLQTIARFLAPYGIPVAETRIVPDVQGAIIAALNSLRSRYSYVFTTGGIGPTHDDITAGAVAAAFNAPLVEHPGALHILKTRYAAVKTELTPARRRMACMPSGADLIDNPVSGAPGFQIENVFVLAGVPKIVAGMLNDIGHRLQSGVALMTVTVRGAGLREGDLADDLNGLATDFPGISLGSYPWFHTLENHGVALVARGSDQHILQTVADRLVALVKAQGSQPECIYGDEPTAQSGNPRPGVD